MSAIDHLLAGPATDAERGHALEATVRAIADNRRALLPHRAVAPGLTSTVKDPWRIEPPPLELGALVSSLPASATISVRLDPALTVVSHHDGPLGTATIEDSELRFTRARRVTARVTGTPERLTLLELLIAGRTRIEASELNATLLPKDIVAFDALADRRRDDFEALLVGGRELVERAERLVCRLYRVPAELEEEVVAHGVARAQRATADPADSD